MRERGETAAQDEQKALSQAPPWCRHPRDDVASRQGPRQDQQQQQAEALRPSMAVERQAVLHQAKEQHPDGGEGRRDRCALEAPEPSEKARATQQEQAAQKEQQAQPRRRASANVASQAPKGPGQGAPQAQQNAQPAQQTQQARQKAQPAQWMQQARQETEKAWRRPHPCAVGEPDRARRPQETQPQHPPAEAQARLGIRGLPPQDHTPRAEHPGRQAGQRQERRNQKEQQQHPEMEKHQQQQPETEKQQQQPVADQQQARRLGEHPRRR